MVKKGDGLVPSTFHWFDWSKSSVVLQFTLVQLIGGMLGRLGDKFA